MPWKRAVELGHALPHMEIAASHTPIALHAAMLRKKPARVPFAEERAALHFLDELATARRL